MGLGGGSPGTAWKAPEISGQAERTVTVKPRWNVRFTPQAARDLERAVEFLVERDARAAGRARREILKAIEMLELFPRSCRRAAGTTDETLRELVISFGKTGYVLLFRIVVPATISVLGIRHHREDGYRS